MEKLHSQLPQPLKRCSPSRAGDLLTQIKNSNSPVPNRSPARRTVTSSPNNIRSRDTAAMTVTSRQPPEVKARSPEVLSRSRENSGTATPTRRPKYSPATSNGNTSPVAGSKISRQQLTGMYSTAVSDSKQSPIKSIAARLPVKTKSPQPTTLRPTVESQFVHVSDDKEEGFETSQPWAENVSRTGGSGTVSGIKNSLSPKCERRVDFKKTENVDDEDRNNGGGSPIYHELDPPGSSHFPIQHTYQSIVEISDELENLRTGSVKPEAAVGDQPSSVLRQQLSRAKSAQELTQKSPTKSSLFSRFRFATKKSSSKSSGGKVERTVCSPDVRGQSSLQDVDLITTSRNEVGVTSSHDRQPSFTTFAHRVPPPACDSDGYSCVYVPQNLPPERPSISAPVPPRTSSLTPDAHKPASVPLYKQKFLKIASVHTLQSSTVDDDRGTSLTSSNSVGDLLLATDLGHQQSHRVTSYDDHAVTTGNRKMAAASARSRADSAKSQIARFGLSPGRAAASFASPSCGIRMAEMRGAVRRCTNDVSAASPTRSPSASTPVPSPSRLSVFQFSVPPPGVMMSPPVHRAYRHVSSQTVMTVRPPSASCVLTVTAVHGPGSPAQMQTIEEEEDDPAGNDELQPTSHSAVTVNRPDKNDRRTRQSGGVQTAGAVVSDGVEQPADRVAGREDDCRLAEGDVARIRTQAEATSKTSRLRRPSPSVASKPLLQGTDHQPSRIVPPSVAAHRRAESSSVSPPSTPRTVDSQPRSGSARAEPLVRRPVTRGQQQQRKQVAPPADCDVTTTVGLTGEGLSVPGVRKQYHRRLAATDASSSTTGSPSGSSVSLLSTGSDVDAHTGSCAPDVTTTTTTDATAAKTPSGTVTNTEPPRSAAIQHNIKYSPSSITSRVGGKFNELTIPVHTDHANY